MLRTGLPWFIAGPIYMPANLARSYRYGRRNSTRMEEYSDLRNELGELGGEVEGRNKGSRIDEHLVNAFGRVGWYFIEEGARRRGINELLVHAARKTDE